MPEDETAALKIDVQQVGAGRRHSRCIVRLVSLTGKPGRDIAVAGWKLPPQGALYWASFVTSPGWPIRNNTR